MWDFLLKPENRDVLAWFGGGVCVVLAGLWTVVKHFTAPPSALAPQPGPQRQVSGRDGVVAGGSLSVGGDVRVGDVVLPRLALGLAALGMALFALALIFGHGETTTGSVTAGGNIEGSTITIGNPAPPPER
jgi:hypothetical protein